METLESRYVFPLSELEMQSFTKEFSLLSQAADMGIKVFGETYEKLFVNAAKGMLSYLITPVNNKVSFDKNITIEAPGREQLLINWLNEIKRISYAQKVMITSFEINEFTENRISAELWGRKLLNGHRFPYEIKTISNMNLKIKKTRNGFKTNIIFDI